ncbi:uncharacterized protein LOC143291792 [Babylonia areolata]|uniref:uncharacterized protein LOC143291792 n=1 Tax=Babylonia areolata TaxID=304850 RepID=UPI003FD105B5
MRDAKIITLYKKKGERRDCNKYRGISLLSIIGKVFARVILIRLQAKKKIQEALIRDMLFADDAAVTTHNQQELQALMDRFSQACKDFGLTISLKKTNILGKGKEKPPAITTDDYKLDIVHQFTLLGSTISNLSLDSEIDKRIRKAATILARLPT